MKKILNLLIITSSSLFFLSTAVAAGESDGLDEEIEVLETKPPPPVAPKRKKHENISIKKIIRKWTLGANAHFSSASQGSRDFTSTEGDAYTIGQFSGTSSFFGGWIEFQWHQKVAIRALVNLRKTDMKGEARLKGSSSFVEPSTVNRQQYLLGGGLMAKYFIFSTKPFWLGLGFEAGKAQKVDLFIDGQKQPLAGTDLPAYFYGFVDLGYDWSLSSHWLLSPELRFGRVVTTDPGTNVYDIGLSIAYVF
jgi:hypothetical protein